MNELSAEELQELESSVQLTIAKTEETLKQLREFQDKVKGILVKNNFGSTDSFHLCS